jgi:hypothetical protein
MDTFRAGLKPAQVARRIARTDDLFASRAATPDMYGLSTRSIWCPRTLAVASAPLAACQMARMSENFTDPRGLEDREALSDS